MSNDQPKKESKLNRCLVIRSFSLVEKEIHRKWKKNDQNQYVLNKKTRERIQNVISLNDSDMKKALKMKVIEIAD